MRERERIQSQSFCRLDRWVCATHRRRQDDKRYWQIRAVGCDRVFETHSGDKKNDHHLIESLRRESSLSLLYRAKKVETAFSRGRRTPVVRVVGCNEDLAKRFRSSLSLSLPYIKFGTNTPERARDERGKKKRKTEIRKITAA